MYTKLFKVLFFALILIVSNSCKKDPVNPNEGTETPAKASISADESNVKNMQAVLITVANKQVEANYYHAKLGTDSVKLVKVADDQLVFIVPEKTAAGSYSLHVPELAENTLTFQVSEVATIANPDKYIQDFIEQIYGMHTEMLSQIDSLTKDTLVNKGEMMAIANANKDDLAKTISKLQAASAEEKKYAALFIEANRKSLDDIINSLEDMRMGKLGLLNDKTHAKKSHCNDYERFGKMRCLLSEFVIAIAKMSAPAVVGGFTGGALSAWYTGGTFSTGGAEAGAILGTFLFRDFVAAQLNLAVSRALDFAAEPFIMVAEKLAEFNSRGKNVMEFESGKERKVRFTITMRNVDERIDAASEHDFVVSFLQSFKKLQKMWISYYPDANTVLTLPTPKKRSIEPKKMEHMSVKVLNNPKVTGKLSGAPTDLKITFTTEEITDQEFTFEINYNDGFYTNKATQEALLKGKTYKVLTSKFETIYILAIFEHDKAQTFYLTEDEKTPAKDIDYTKISIRNQVNNKVEITLTKNSSNFSIKMKNVETEDQFVFFDVYYGETKIQEISAKAIKKDPCNGLKVTTSISGKTVTATATGGTAPYSYKLIQGSYESPYFVSSNQLNLVVDGSYAVIVKDVNGCVDTSDFGCINDVVITSITTKTALEYDGNVSGTGYLTLTWTSTLGLKPDFLSYASSTSAMLSTFVTSSNTTQHYGPDVNKFCTGSFGYNFGIASSGRVSGTANSGKYTQVLSGKDGGGSNVSFKLIRSCTGEKICPDGGVRQGYLSPEYTITW